MLSVSAIAQRNETTFTGTAYIYGSGLNTRNISRNFTMRLTGQTSPGDASRLISILQESGQNALLRELEGQKVGTFALGGQVGRDINAAEVTNVDGRLRVRAVFARWLGFGELRGGYRSIDYPFTYIELFVDPRTRKGEGTFIPAAQIRFRNRNGRNQIEIEDFGTFPGKLLGVQMRGELVAWSGPVIVNRDEGVEVYTACPSGQFRHCAKLTIGAKPGIAANFAEGT